LTAVWRSLRTLVLALIAAGLLAACRSPATLDSGVEGRVWVGPMCPVIQEGVDCPDAPLAAELVVEGENGRTVARGESDADGLYRIPLAPGDYRLVPQPGENRLPWAPTQDFRVTADEWVRLDVYYDSGIR
jgi:hypothetical protein